MNDNDYSKRDAYAGRQFRRRRGVTMVELVVATGLLVAVMCFVTSLCFRIDSVWKDIGYHRVAVNELSNQLELLTRLSPEEAREAIGSLAPTTVCARTLRDPTLSGEIIEDSLGVRVVLQIDWARKHPGKPVQLVGWLRPGVFQSGIESANVESGTGDILPRAETDQ